jgi:hypothetical protein
MNRKPFGFCATLRIFAVLCALAQTLRGQRPISRQGAKPQSDAKKDFLPISICCVTRPEKLNLFQEILPACLHRYRMQGTVESSLCGFPDVSATLQSKFTRIR